MWSSLTTLSEPLIHHHYQQTDTDTQRPTLKRTRRAERTGRGGGGGGDDRRGENKEWCQGITAVGKTIDGLRERGEGRLEERERVGGGRRKGKQMLQIWKQKEIFQHIGDHGNKDEQIAAENYIMCPQWQSGPNTRGKWASLTRCNTQTILGSNPGNRSNPQTDLRSCEEQPCPHFAGKIFIGVLMM